MVLHNPRNIFRRRQVASKFKIKKKKQPYKVNGKYIAVQTVFHKYRQDTLKFNRGYCTNTTMHIKSQ